MDTAVLTTPRPNNSSAMENDELTRQRAELATLIAQTIGYAGELVFDTSRPDGMMRKVLDVSRLKSLGWQPQVSLEEGLTRMYNWYLKNLPTARAS